MTGRVTGTVVYDALEVKRGGCVTGHLTQSATEEPAPSPVVTLAASETAPAAAE